MGRVHREGRRAETDECKCLAWITGLQEGGVSAGLTHSCPGTQDHEKLKSVSPRTGNVKCL